MPEYRMMEWTPERIERFWEWQAEFPEQYFTHILGARIASRLSGYFPPNARILDLGCGLGHLIPHLSTYAREVVGIDASVAAIQATRARCHELGNFGGAFLLEEIGQIPGKFDVITVIEVVEHLTDEQLRGLLQTARSLVAPAGVVIFTTPNEEPLEQSMIYSPATGEVFHRYQHMRRWTAESLRDCVQSGGFDVVETVTTDFSLTWRQKLRRLISRIVRLGRVPPIRPPHLMCVARPRQGA